MITNSEKQNELADAVGAQTTTLYSGVESKIKDCTAIGKAAMRAFGEGVDDEKASAAARQTTQKAVEFASNCVWLGLLAQGKKEYLDARGNFADQTQRGEGFEAWAQRVLGNTVSMRHLRRYMEAARAFLVDFESVCGEVPNNEELLLRSVETWCGERTLADIRRDIRAEQQRKELVASEHSEPAPEAPTPPADATAELLQKFDKMLDRAEARDNELKNAFEQVVAQLDNPQTCLYLEALAKHYGDLNEFYGKLAAKAKQAGENAIQS